MYDKQIVKDRLVDYYINTPDPSLLEFCLDLDSPTRETLYEWSKDKDIDGVYGFSDILKKIHDKQELFLTRAKDINPIMAIFRLKQPSFGYKDKQDIDVSTTVSYQIPEQITKLID